MPADIDSPEDLRQAIASLEWENARLRGEVHQAHQLLNGLEALHATRIGDDPFECVFDSLCAVFDFTEAMVLAESDTDELRCVVAEPEHLRGAPWPVGPFFRKVMDGAVTSVFCHDGIAEWRGARDLSLSVDQPALYIPLRVHDRRGVLVLLRAAGTPCFSRDDVALGERFALLASLALAALDARQLIDESTARAAAAETANRAKNLFLANISHELRTPLNAIIGFSELMEHEIFGPVTPIAYGEYVSDIRHSGEHLLAIINNILQFSRAEAGAQRVAVEPISLAAELEVVRRMVVFDAKQRDVRLDFAPIPEGEVVETDPLALRQILLNVIGNAVKFSDAGSIVSVTISTGSQRGGYRLTVADTGCGMPARVLQQLGKPFTQAEGAYVRSHQGMGLGLAICLGLADSIGARLDINSRVGKGTTVTLHLPRQAPPEQTETEATPPPIATRLARTG